MERPKPTQQLLIELCGENQGLISSLHHGLYEVSLKDFYPHLDLDELVAFAASSWKSRESRQEIGSGSVYDIFNQVFKIGFPWLNKYKKILPDLREKYEKTNPFKGKDLRQRLERVEPGKVQTLKEKLQEGVHEYVFGCQYYQRKGERGGDNYNLEIMHFQNEYPKKGRIVPAFAAEVARMLSDYPREYKLLEGSQTSLF